MLCIVLYIDINILYNSVAGWPWADGGLGHPLADKNLQADILGGREGGVYPPSSAFFGDFMMIEVLYRL